MTQRPRSIAVHLVLAALVLAALALPLAADEAASGDVRPMRTAALSPRIVNGNQTSVYPSTVALLTDDYSFCSGTLIGCGTVLTAAHCVCLTQGSDCQPGGFGLTPANQIRVFAQSGGEIYGVTEVIVHPDYVFGETRDVALLRLSPHVEGIGPTPINTVSTPALGSAGHIVGFGITDGNVSDGGIKRVGGVTTAACTDVPAPAHVCWEFADPVGPQGVDSNTCSGDSGGPLFMNLGGVDVVAGITSGGTSDDCQPLDRSFDTNVFVNRQWIENQVGADLGNTTCGDLPNAFEADTILYEGGGNLSAAHPENAQSFEVPEGATLLRVTLNGDDRDTNDFDLAIQHGAIPTLTDADCASDNLGVFETCEVVDPVPGTWYMLGSRFDGPGGDYQATATVYLSGKVAGECTPGATTLCIDDVPGDRRFMIEIDYATVANGGTSGQGKAIPLASLGVRRGGLFWFFDATNPEVLIKVLRGCDVPGYDTYWVFWSAGTNVGLQVKVTDTKTNTTKVYTNADGHTAEPVADLYAFACDP